MLNCASVDSRGDLAAGDSGGRHENRREGRSGAGNDVTCDLAIRQAINYGVDRDKMIDNVLNGYGTVAYSVGDGMPWSSPDMKCSTDVEKAKKLLDDGGWTAGADGIREKDGTRAAFNLYYSAGDTVRQGIAEEFTNQMKELGIEVSIKGASWDDLYPHQFTDPVVWGWGTNAPTEIYNLFYSKGTGNYACYTSETTDKYLDEALAQPTVEESFDLWKKAQWDGQSGIAPQGDAPWVCQFTIHNAALGQSLPNGDGVDVVEPVLFRFGVEPTLLDELGNPALYLGPGQHRSFGAFRANRNGVLPSPPSNSWASHAAVSFSRPCFSM